MEWDEYSFGDGQGKPVLPHKAYHPVHCCLKQIHEPLDCNALLKEQTPDVCVQPYSQVIGVHGYDHLPSTWTMTVKSSGAMTEPCGTPISPF